jgi:guanosine-3',5'-bis(diphosphate) 3'-pyrophosphohydrolase
MDDKNNITCHNILNAPSIYRSISENNSLSKAAYLATKYHSSINLDQSLVYDPLFVAKVLIDMKLDNNSIIAAFLYDLFKDSILTLSSIEDSFGSEVVCLVENLDKALKVQLPQNQIMTYPEKCRMLLMSIVSDVRVLLIILARRLEIMNTITNNIVSKEERDSIANETLKVYAPIAERIGLFAIKSKLYELCFEVLHSNARKFILSKLSLIHGNDTNYLDFMRDEIQELCASQNIRAVVSGRFKAPYSIWLKMDRKKKSIEQLLDIIGFRIVVDDIKDCYKVLNIITSRYKCVGNSYRDFIQRPKDNGYQSIHITIIGKRKEEVEIQIRTSLMHETAESGNAAHWRYKQDHTNEDWEQYELIKGILADFYKTNDLKIFLKSAKISMYCDRVFCVTQDERVLALRQTSTPLDLAYKLHYTMGDCCSMAKVNGHLVPLEHKLETGDNVEIITSKSCDASLVLQDPLHNYRTPSLRLFVARNKSMLRINCGQALINEFYKGINVQNSCLVLREISNFFKHKDINDLYLATCKGSVRMRKVICYILTKSSLSKLTPSLLFYNYIMLVNNGLQNYDIAYIYMLHFSKFCNFLSATRAMDIKQRGYGNATIDNQNYCSMVKGLQCFFPKVKSLCNFNQASRTFS